MEHREITSPVGWNLDEDSGVAAVVTDVVVSLFLLNLPYCKMVLGSILVRLLLLVGVALLLSSHSH